MWVVGQVLVVPEWVHTLFNANLLNNCLQSLCC